MNIKEMKHPVDIWSDWSFKAGLAAFVVLKDGQQVANICFKTTGRTSSNGGLTVKSLAWEIDTEKHTRTNCFQKRATGGGYDMHSAAISGFTIQGYTIEDSGARWDSQLQDQGFVVIRAI